MQIREVFRAGPPANNEIARIRQFMVATVAGLAVLGAGVAYQELTETERPVPTVTGTIGQGETVWGLAKPYADEHCVDIRDVVDDIFAMSPELTDENGVQPGDQYKAPATSKQILSQQADLHQEAGQGNQYPISKEALAAINGFGC